MKEQAITAADAAELTDTATARPRRWPRLLLMFGVPLLIAAIGGYFWLTSGRYVSTDNAYVQQDKVSVSAEVSGPVVEVAVRENQQVRKGDLLFRIDSRPYRIALAQAEAQLDAARVQVAGLQTELAGSGADIQGAQSNLEVAERAFRRQQELLESGFTTRVNYDAAALLVTEARERLANARTEAQKAQAALARGGVSSQPAVEAAIAARDKALLDLRRTEVRAPSDGRVSQTDRLQVGSMVVAGVPLVTIVRGDGTYVEANFKETDLADMRVGQPVEIELDAYPGVGVRGRVASIGAGTGSEFSVLPAQNATGNWVKVTQRVPVRVAIEGRPQRPMIAGLSAEVTVDTQGGRD